MPTRAALSAPFFSTACGTCSSRCIIESCGSGGSGSSRARGQPGRPAGRRQRRRRHVTRPPLAVVPHLPHHRGAARVPYLERRARGDANAAAGEAEGACAPAGINHVWGLQAKYSLVFFIMQASFEYSFSAMAAAYLF